MSDYLDIWLLLPIQYNTYGNDNVTVDLFFYKNILCYDLH